jgi:hypothetical protein
VQERFGEVSAMFVVDEIVAGAVRAFTNTVYRIASWLPGVGRPKHKRHL